MKLLHVIGILCLYLVVSTPSYSSYLFNNRDTLIGGKAALLGGAYTALSDDLSGAYYNPSGIVSSDNVTELPFTIYSFKRVERLNTTDGNIVRNSDDSLSTAPTSLGRIWRLSTNTAASIALFKTDDIDFRSFGYNTIFPNGFDTIELSQQTWLGGPSIAKHLTPSIDLGISLFMQYSSVRFVGRYDSDIVMANRQNDTWSLGLVPEIGLKWKAANDLMFGLTWSGETHNLTGNNHAIFQPIELSPPFRAPIQIKEGKGDIRTPNKVSFGIATALPCHCRLSLDYIYYFALDYPFPNEPLRTTESINHHKERTHHDISIGGEWHTEDSIWSVLVGIFTNSSSATSQNLSEKVDSYGASLGLTKRVKYGQISGGVVAQYGSSPEQTSDYYQVAGYAESASWKRTQINFIVGFAVPFGTNSSVSPIQPLLVY